jgi:hypothetical protein
MTTALVRGAILGLFRTHTHGRLLLQAHRDDISVALRIASLQTKGCFFVQRECLWGKMFPSTRKIRPQTNVTTAEAEWCGAQDLAC